LVRGIFRASAKKKATVRQTVRAIGKYAQCKKDEEEEEEQPFDDDTKIYGNSAIYLLT
jgi:hypothetical protein